MTTEKPAAVKPAVKKSELAKKPTPATKDTKPAAVKKAKDVKPTLPYGINELAKELATEPAAVRGRLRRSGVEKNGSQYGWQTKAEMDAVVKKLKAA